MWMRVLCCVRPDVSRARDCLPMGISDGRYPGDGACSHFKSFSLYSVHSIKIYVVNKVPENTLYGSVPNDSLYRAPMKLKWITQLGLEV